MFGLNKKQYVLESGTEVVKPRNYTILILIAFIFFVIVSIYVTDFDLLVLFEKADKFWDIIIAMIPTSFNKFVEQSVEVFPELLITLEIALLGTIIGSIIAFPIAFLCAQNTINSKLIRTTTRILLTLVRTIPVLIYALIAAYIFGIGEFAGLIAVILFTIGIITKMFYEVIENASMNPYEAALASGSSRLKANEATIIPQVMPQYISMVLYNFEINVRSAAILGYVGAGGVGFIIKESMALRNYQMAGVVIFWLIVTVMIIDGLSNYLRRRLLNG